jgi:hypothetical protein
MILLVFMYVNFQHSGAKENWRVRSSKEGLRQCISHLPGGNCRSAGKLTASILFMPSSNQRCMYQAHLQCKHLVTSFGFALRAPEVILGLH